MQTFSMFFSEDAGEKFRNMSDDQFSGWKKANPGAAKKADELRSGKKAPTTAAPKAAPGKNLPGDKPGGPLSAKGGALAKHRKSEMGKWAEGSKKSPSALAKKASSALTTTSSPKEEPATPKKKRETVSHYVPRVRNPGRTLTEPTGGDLGDKQKKQKEKIKYKKKKDSGEGLLTKLRKKTMSAGRDSLGNPGTSSSGDLEGLSGRDKGLGN